MNAKSAFLKWFAAFSIVLLTVSSWAADSATGSSKVFCVKRIDWDGAYYVQLSQRDSGYVEDVNEFCSENWTSGETSARDYVSDIVSDRSNPIAGVVLASDIDFGGFDDSSHFCRQRFDVLPLEVLDGELLITSLGETPFTIRGLCFMDYQPVAFAKVGYSAKVTVDRINFEDLRLESMGYVAGLLVAYSSGYGVSFSTVGVYSYSNIAVSNAVVSGATSGLLAGIAGEVHVSSFAGKDILVTTQSESYPYSGASGAPVVGGLFGNVKHVDIENVSIKNLLVKNNMSVGGIVGGLAGMTGGGTISKVGIDSLVVEEQMLDGDFVGGLVGLMQPCDSYTQKCTSVQLVNTYTRGEVFCAEGASSGLGFVIGGLEIAKDFESYEYTVDITANYHFSEDATHISDTAFVGGIVGSAIYELESSTKLVGRYGKVLVGDGSTETKSYQVAKANFRNAVGTLQETGSLDPETYVFAVDVEGGDDVVNGILPSDYMETDGFIDVMNFHARSYAARWEYGKRFSTPSIAGLPDIPNDPLQGHALVVFDLSCIESGCITTNERNALEQFAQFREDNVFTFQTDADGHIDAGWESFAIGLTGTKENREPVCWQYSDEGVPFAAGNVYESGDRTYTLAVCAVAESPVMASAFFGEGVDYAKTPVTLMSLHSDSLTGKLEEIESVTNGGEGSALTFEAGDVVMLYSSTPATTDGSKFLGWKMLAAYSYFKNPETLLRKAKTGVPIPSDSNGYFNLAAMHAELQKSFEKDEDYKEYLNVVQEMDKVQQEMLDDPELDDAKVSIYERKLDSLLEVRNSYKAVVAMFIYPEGFAEENGVTENSENDEPDEGLPQDSVYARLLQSGNAVQLCVLGTAAKGASVEAVLVRIGDDGDDVHVRDTAFVFVSSDSSGIEQWNVAPLVSGLYLMSVEVKTDSFKYVEEWDFEVMSKIAEMEADSWKMISLSNVDFDDYEWSGDGIFYWWDESRNYGKYWQYQELSKKESPERGRGYWYSSIGGYALKLTDDTFAEASVWRLDSVNSGWNMVSNPYGWYLKLEENDSVEFWHWNSNTAEYEKNDELAPYEAVWAKVLRGTDIEWKLDATPSFDSTVNRNGEAVQHKPLERAKVLAKTVGNVGWALQAKLYDGRGHQDSWNVLGVGDSVRKSEEPPAGMGDHVDLSIMESGKRLAKSVKAYESESGYEWEISLSATSEREGYLELYGTDALAAQGLSVFVSVDGKTERMSEGNPLQVTLSPSPKMAKVFVGSAPKVVAHRKALAGLRALQAGSMLQVEFLADAGAGGNPVRVELVDMKGNVVRSVDVKSLTGFNSVALEAPKAGVYMLRVRMGNAASVVKILIR